MPTRFLTEQQVIELLSMSDCIEAVAEAFRALDRGDATNIPRARATVPGSLLHTMSAGADYLGVLGWKAYTSTRSSLRFHVSLYDAETGEWIALMQADALGQLRTGASTGVACRALRKAEPQSVGIVGTGTQARTQLLAIHAVLPLAEVFVYSRDEQRRAEFAQRMSAELNHTVSAANSPTEAVRERSIVVTATTSRTPVLDAADLSPGTLVCAIGSNFRQKQEVSIDVIRRCRQVFVDDRQQCQIEAGELIAAVADDTLQWDQVNNLGHHLNAADESHEFNENGELVLYKSVGLAVQDVAVAQIIYERACQQNVGTLLDL